jgi:hypothetical protein
MAHPLNTPELGGVPRGVLRGVLGVYSGVYSPGGPGLRGPRGPRPGGPLLVPWAWQMRYLVRFVGRAAGVPPGISERDSPRPVRRQPGLRGRHRCRGAITEHQMHDLAGKSPAKLVRWGATGGAWAPVPTCRRAGRGEVSRPSVGTGPSAVAGPVGRGRSSVSPRCGPWSTGGPTQGLGEATPRRGTATRQG